CALPIYALRKVEKLALGIDRGTGIGVPLPAVEERLDVFRHPRNLRADVAGLERRLGDQALALPRVAFAQQETVAEKLHRGAVARVLAVFLPLRDEQLVHELRIGDEVDVAAPDRHSRDRAVTGRNAQPKLHRIAQEPVEAAEIRKTDRSC